MLSAAFDLCQLDTRAASRVPVIEGDSCDSFRAPPGPRCGHVSGLGSFIKSSCHQVLASTEVWGVWIKWSSKSKLARHLFSLLVSSWFSDTTARDLASVIAFSKSSGVELVVDLAMELLFHMLIGLLLGICRLCHVNKSPTIVIDIFCPCLCCENKSLSARLALECWNLLFSFNALHRHLWDLSWSWTCHVNNIYIFVFSDQRDSSLLSYYQNWSLIYLSIATWVDVYLNQRWPSGI
jgi:hypothetical protein